MDTRQRLNVLLIEDDEDDYVLLKDILNRQTAYACKLEWRSTCLDILNVVRGGSFDLIVLGYSLNHMTGVEVLELLRSNGVLTPAILLTSWDYDQVQAQALAAGASCVLSKYNLDREDLIAAIRLALRRPGLLTRL